MTSLPHLNRIGTAAPRNDVHAAFVAWAERQAADPRARALFGRMAGRSGIDRRWSVLLPGDLGDAGFYGGDAEPGTGARMARYAAEAPPLALAAIEALGELGAITHLVVASCTGFVAPGIDQIIARRLGLAADVQRTLIGFMGCYAAATALRTAYQIVRADGDARVLVVTVELCTLHLQRTPDVERLLAMLLFGDGVAAAIVSAAPAGLELVDPFSLALEESADLITWTIGDRGFAMTLSGAVPARLGSALADPAVAARVRGGATPDSWAVHGGGRSILDAVATRLDLAPQALDDSRAVLRDYGNMSSATLMFVLRRVLERGGPIRHGRAIAFGPGLAAEGFGYRRAG